MHPVIRVVSLIVFGTAVSLGPADGLWLAFCFVLSGYVAVGVAHIKTGLKLIRRMRWFFLSILVVFFWFTPGIFILPSLADWSPTYEGARIGLLRVSMLLTLMLAVNLLLRTTDRGQLVSALLWLFQPLSLLGVDIKTIAVRMVLTLETVEHVQELMALQHAELKTKENTGIKTRVTHLAIACVDIFREALNQAQQSQLVTVSVSLTDSPPKLQWLYPVMVGAGIIWFHQWVRLVFN